MLLTITKETGTTEGAVDVSDEIFGKAFNEPLVHQVVNACLAGQRQGTRAQKNRAAVRGGGRKPWRQKGTGRARAGTIRSPLWRGGGRVFPASTQSFRQKVNKKMYRGAICSILSELVRQDRLVVVEDFSAAEPKTKALIARLQSMNLSNVLVVTTHIEQPLYLSARNLQHVEVRAMAHLDPVSLIRYDKVLMTLPVVEELGRWAS